MSKPKTPRVNGGKYGFHDYKNAETAIHDVEGIKCGALCQCCHIGKYYYGEDKKQLEFTGGPILRAKRHIKKALRCNACGHEIVNRKKIIKWTSEARSALAIHKVYGTPWHRMSRIQKLCGVPVAASTMWGQTESLWQEVVQPIVSKLYSFGVESPLWCTDDTGMKILSILKANKSLKAADQRACHTTAICGFYGKYKILLYITANRYCRENWVPLLADRKTQEKVIVMTDASNQSLPKGDEFIRVESAICLGQHGRGKFKDLETNYPADCGYFLNLISDLYKNEANCKDKNPQERLEYHQKYSQGIVDAIYSKIDDLFNHKIIEPNSDLGKAMNYWRNHKQGLTAFLRIKGAPLDNNMAENALRIMAIYRNNSLFFKTLQSALVMNDLFSLVATCEANGINAFEYLNWLQAHWKAVQSNAEAYLPWCFKQETERIAA